MPRKIILDQLERFGGRWPPFYLSEETKYCKKETLAFYKDNTEENRRKVLECRTKFYLLWIKGGI